MSIRRAALAVPSFQPLEARQLFAAVTQINFPNFSSITNLVGNGFAGPLQSGNKLRMTDGLAGEGRSVWFGTKVPIGKFTTTFSFVSAADSDSADGLTFVVQNGTTAALGSAGLNLGYTGITNSHGIGFNLYNLGNFGSQFGFLANGDIPATTTPMANIDLHGGHAFNAIVVYDGVRLKLTLTDASDSTKSFTASEPLALTAGLGVENALVGFTASTGVKFSTQDLLSWTYSGSTVPTISSAARSKQHATTSSTLNVKGADSAGASGLTYTWSLLRKPPGAADPTYSANGTNAARTTIATFKKDGTYKFRVTIANSGGGTVTDDVSYVVRQVATSMSIEPHKEVVSRGKTIDYDAVVFDQFHRDLRTQPAISFSILEGSGTIDSDSGLFTASATKKGHISIQAAAGDLLREAGGTVVA